MPNDTEEVESLPAAATAATPAAAAQPNATQQFAKRSQFQHPPKRISVQRESIPGQGRTMAKPAAPAAEVAKPLPAHQPSDKFAVELHRAACLTPTWKFRAAAAKFRWAVGAELTEAEYSKAIDSAVNARFGGM